MKNKKLNKLISIFIIISICTMSIIGCSKQQKNTETIKIATKPMTEQFILAEMLRLLIEENTNLKVEITKGIGGGTSNIHPALLKGDFDLYPEYTGTSWSYVLKEKEIPDEKALYEKLCKEYEEKYNLKWSGLYGFNNTFGLVVRKEIADKYKIKTYSDLAKYSSQLNFGAEYDFYEREDGYDALCSEYNFKFKSTKDLDIGLKYQAINSKEIDVMNVFTTDGQLSVSDVVLLEDDKNFYETYYCGTVVRKDSLEKYPELEAVLMKMDNVITSSDMAHMNYRLEAKGESENEIAKDFLQSKGLIK